MAYTHEIYRDKPYHKQWVTVYQLMAHFYSRQNNLDLAITYTDSVIQKSINPTSHPNLKISSLQNLSNYDLFLYYNQKAHFLEKRMRDGDTQKALEFALKSTQIFEQTLRKINHHTSKKKLLQEHGTSLFETPIRLAIKLADAIPEKKYFYHIFMLFFLLFFFTVTIMGLITLR